MSRFLVPLLLLGTLLLPWTLSKSGCLLYMQPGWETLLYDGFGFVASLGAPWWEGSRATLAALRFQLAAASWLVALGGLLAWTVPLRRLRPWRVPAPWLVGGGFVTVLLLHDGDALGWPYASLVAAPALLATLGFTASYRWRGADVAPGLPWLVGLFLLVALFHLILHRVVMGIGGALALGLLAHATWRSRLWLEDPISDEEEPEQLGLPT